MSLTRMFTAGMAKNWVHFLHFTRWHPKTQVAAQWLSLTIRRSWPPVRISAFHRWHPNAIASHPALATGLHQYISPDITRYPGASGSAQVTTRGPRFQHVPRPPGWGWAKVSKTRKPQNGPRKTSPSLANCFIFGQWISNLSRTWMVPKQFLKQLHVLFGLCQTLGRTGWFVGVSLKSSKSLVLWCINWPGSLGLAIMAKSSKRPSPSGLHWCFSTETHLRKKCPRNGYLAFCPTNHHSKWNGAVAAVPVPSYFVRFSQFCQSVPVLISGKFKAFLEENIFLLGIPTDL